MRLLLDTHALIWWLAGDPSLSASARAAIAELDNEVFVSAASAWEIATKYRIGKLPQAQHGQTAGSLPGPHRDPFDRMLIAQAMLADLVLVSSEAVFDRYGVRRLW